MERKFSINLQNGLPRDEKNIEVLVETQIFLDGEWKKRSLILPLEVVEKMQKSGTSIPHSDEDSQEIFIRLPQ